MGRKMNEQYMLSAPHGAPEGEQTRTPSAECSPGEVPS